MLVFTMEHLAEVQLAHQLGWGKMLGLESIRVFLVEVVLGHDHWHVD
jgi:hypothetical protein